MASKVENEMWARLDKVNTERDALLKKVAPLKAELEKHCLARNAANEKAMAKSAEIDAILHPRIHELGKERSMLSRALSGKKRPTPEKSAA